MRSASPLIVALAALVLAGCATTTQRRSERLKLRADRTLASRRPLRVRAAGDEVAVQGVALVRGSRRRTAVVVELSNRTPRALSDIPLTVGVGRTALNARGGLGFYQNHVAAIAAHARVTWVFTTRGRVPRGRPFAVAGAAARSPAGLPRVIVAAAGTRVALRNASGVPQYGLPVYAVALRRGRYVAAGRATADLGGGASALVSLPLVGSARGAAIQLEALPTVYR